MEKNNKTNKRKIISLDTKLKVIKRFDNGESKASISRTLGFGESTVRAILNKANDYLQKAKLASISSSMQCTRNRSALKIEMEGLLLIWLEDCNQKRIPIDENKTQIKALSLFSSLKEKKYQGDTTNFSASKGWLVNFKARSGIRNIKLTEELANTDKDSTSKYTIELKKIIEENGYDFHQILNDDTRAFLARIGKDISFEDVDSKNVQEILTSHSKELSDDDLLEIEHLRPYKQEDSNEEEEETDRKDVSLNKLEELYNTIERAKDLILEIDTDEERSMNVCRGLDEQIDCYRNILEEKKNIFY